MRTLDMPNGLLTCGYLGLIIIFTINLGKDVFKVTVRCLNYVHCLIRSIIPSYWLTYETI